MPIQHITSSVGDKKISESEISKRDDDLKKEFHDEFCKNENFVKKEIQSLNSEIEEINNRLKILEESHWKKFIYLIFTPFIYVYRRLHSVRDIR